MDELRKAFDDYLNILRNEFAKPIDEASLGEIVFREWANKYAELNSIINRLEEHPAFHSLVSASQTAFLGEGKCLVALMVNWNLVFGKPCLPKLLWVAAIPNFFRRSGCYNDFYERKEVDNDKLFNSFCSALKKSEIEITYLIPLEGVRFNNTSMDFQGFEVRQFIESELESFLQNRINEAFYKWAVSDVSLLTNHWFLCIKESVPVSEMFESYLRSEDKIVPSKFNRYSLKIQRALQILSLYSWGNKVKAADDELDDELIDFEEATELITEEEARKKKAEIKKTQIKGLKSPFTPFKCPFVFELDDNLINFPSKKPSLSIPQKDELLSKISSLADEEIAKELGIEKMPFPRLHFNESETNYFESKIRETKEIIDNLSADANFEFITIATGYLVKAFFSEGLDQLLWHIAVLEALLGEKEEIRNRIARRVAIILGDTEAKREALRKQINELYDFRSDLVHGNKFRKDVEAEHLWIARNLARKTLLWFLNYLNHLKKEGHNLPDREDILLLLDLKERKKLSIKGLLDSLPQGFPNNKEWIE